MEARVTDVYPPQLTREQQAAWRPALKAAYKARGVKRRPCRSFDFIDLWNVECLRAARDLIPQEQPREPGVANNAPGRNS
jgi:hypothetical protein